MDRWTFKALAVEHYRNGRPLMARYYLHLFFATY